MERQTPEKRGVGRECACTRKACRHSSRPRFRQRCQPESRPQSFDLSPRGRGDEGRGAAMNKGLSGIIVGLLATTAWVAPACAQEAAPAAPAVQDDAQGEEIVVTGIRASQQAAIDIKRDETAIVDAISAEDIGKLPDVTIVDAL